jgi:hypothetical protein
MGDRVQKGCNVMLCDTTVVKLLVQLVNLVNFGFCLACVAPVHHNFWDLVSRNISRSWLLVLTVALVPKSSTRLVS